MCSREYRERKSLYKATFSSAFFSVAFGLVTLVFYFVWRSYIELWSGCLIASILSLVMFVIFLLKLIVHIKKYN